MVRWRFGIIFMAIILIALLSTTTTQANQIVYGAKWMGIPSDSLDTVYSEQENSQWCWAACIEMLMNYHKVTVSQKEIVFRSYGVDPYGQLPDWPGSWQTISNNLNGWGIDANKTSYTVFSEFYPGAVNEKQISEQLLQGQPIIVGYRSGPLSGHAVLLTAASYNDSPIGPRIMSVVVRDPWPSDINRKNQGKVEWDAGQFSNLVMGMWRIQVQRSNKNQYQTHKQEVIDWGEFCLAVKSLAVGANRGFPSRRLSRRESDIDGNIRYYTHRCPKGWQDCDVWRYSDGMWEFKADFYNGDDREIAVILFDSVIDALTKKFKDVWAFEELKESDYSKLLIRLKSATTKYNSKITIGYLESKPQGTIRVSISAETLLK
ncbi:MAG: hypothetical protein GY839_14095 [candidate division Zixibacteria bacterium]|nr:hypothetical protein [candidate division Zixibacteria bacterium]